jgi:hypothetical protein
MKQSCPMALSSLIVALSVTSSASADAVDMLPWLENVATWASQLDLPTNSIRGGNMTHDGGTDHIFVNGNLARVLLATWRLQERKAPGSGVSTYLHQGLAWCDRFVSLQANVHSSRGNAAGYWGAGYPYPPGCTPPLRGSCAHGGNIYFGDTGTAATVLGLCHRLSAGDEARRSAYLGAMQKFGTFVLEGSSEVPVDKKGTSSGFVDESTGAVGCGYYGCSNRTKDDCSKVAPLSSNLNCPSVSPYTIATGTTGGAFFSELYALTRNETHAKVATGALRYEASVTMASGEIPYLLDGANCSTASCPASLQVSGPWPFDTISYVVEGVAGVALHMPSQESTLRAQWGRTVEYLVRTQAADGTWGSGGDAMRSPRCLTLLSWWLRAVKAEAGGYDPYNARAAVDKYLKMLRTQGAAYGINTNAITTGMAGIAVADELSFGVTYGAAMQ